MAFRIRKSFTIAKGIKVNFGRSGPSLSFGTKGFRTTINSSGRRTHSIGIPGTGVSYTTTSSGRLSSKPLFDDLTTQKKDNLDNQGIIEEYFRLVNNLITLHLHCDEKVDWQSIASESEPFSIHSIGPNQMRSIENLERYKPNLIERVFKSKREKKVDYLKMQIKESIEIDKIEYESWEKRKILATKVLQKNIDTYFEVIQEKNPLKDLHPFGTGFDYICNDGETMEVSFKVKIEEVVPRYILSLTKTGRISRKESTKSVYYELVQDYVASAAFRIARDIFALLPLNNVAIHVNNSFLDLSTGLEHEVTILSVNFDFKTFEELNFVLIDPSEALVNFDCNMSFMKTSGLKPVDKISI